MEKRTTERHQPPESVDSARNFGQQPYLNRERAKLSVDIACVQILSSDGIEPKRSDDAQAVGYSRAFLHRAMSPHVKLKINASASAALFNVRGRSVLVSTDWVRALNDAI